MIKSRYLLWVILFCLPMFFINVKDSHDWGDDFAQYLIQAENIVKGKPQAKSAYVYDERFPLISPPAYPAGFPLLLSSVYALKGHSIKQYQYLITAVLFLYCILMAVYFRKYFSAVTAFFMVMIFAYNPWTLSFKMEILSDLPFSLLLLLSFIYYQNSKQNKDAVFTGFLLGLLISFRGAGVVLLVAIVIHALHRYLTDKKNRKIIFSQLTLILVSSLLVYGLINIVLFPIAANDFFGFYKNAWSQSNPADIVVQNLNYYVDVFRAYYHPLVKEWTFATSVAESMAICFLLVGMLYSWTKNRSFMDLAVLCYMLLILFYPYTNSGFRFILPVLPFLMMYVVIGLKQVSIEINVPRYVVTAAIGISVLFLYKPSLEKYVEERKQVIAGPQETTSVEAFQYISNHLPPDAVLIFKKPKALALYTGMKTASFVNTQTTDEAQTMVSHLGVTHFLINQDVEDKLLQEYITRNPDEIKEMWRNHKFSLYEYTGK
jgi:hypothetical protein